LLILFGSVLLIFVLVVVLFVIFVLMWLLFWGVWVLVWVYDCSLILCYGLICFMLLLLFDVDSLVGLVGLLL